MSSHSQSQPKVGLSQERWKVAYLILMGRLNNGLRVPVPNSLSGEENPYRSGDPHCTSKALNIVLYKCSISMDGAIPYG
jgi:hypothetical protein